MTENIFLYRHLTTIERDWKRKDYKYINNIIALLYNKNKRYFSLILTKINYFDKGAKIKL